MSNCFISFCSVLHSRTYSLYFTVCIFFIESSLLFTVHTAWLLFSTAESKENFLLTKLVGISRHATYTHTSSNLKSAFNLIFASISNVKEKHERKNNFWNTCDLECAQTFRRLLKWIAFFSYCCHFLYVSEMHFFMFVTLGFFLTPTKCSVNLTVCNMLCFVVRWREKKFKRKLVSSKSFLHTN